ncbi:site-specific integrase [Conexibacter sp. DBS9H8]|uniref:tyrosine-type recombinase/integrase n=1 Tax=Conexibacter sp. DBS9H8 TaxID=2937801 RepID=UPI00200C6471|nr:site-specific integrase [Conexibacter sp. DBS9H8]
MNRPTGHIEVRQLKGGDTFYAKLKLADGSQARRSLGKVWAKRSAPPAGYLTHRQAEAKLAEILAGKDPSVEVNRDPNAATFRQACDEFMRHRRDDRQRKTSTLRDYESVIEYRLVPRFGADTQLRKITTEQIDAFRDDLLAGVSHRTAQKTLAVLAGILERAKRRRWIDSNPCDIAEKVTLRRSDEINVLTADEVLLVSAAAPQLYCAAIQTAAFTGLRMGELLALRWRHVNITDRILHVQRSHVRGEETSPKSHKRRAVPLSDQAIRALDAASRREFFTGPDDYVFTETGGPLSEVKLRDTFYAALGATLPDKRPGKGHRRRADGAGTMTFHDLRHTFGTLAAGNGVELVRLQRWMGHADIQTTMRYAHYTPAHDDAARLTAAFSRGSGFGTQFGTELSESQRISGATAGLRSP